MFNLEKTQRLEFPKDFLWGWDKGALEHYQKFFKVLKAKYENFCHSLSLHLTSLVCQKGIYEVVMGLKNYRRHTAKDLLSTISSGYIGRLKKEWTSVAICIGR